MIKNAVNLDEKSREYLERMRNSAYRMNQFILDLLQFSKISAKPWPLKKVDLENTVKLVCEEIDHIVHAANGAVNISNLPEIEGDESQLKQLFNNLITNSFKYKKEDETPVVNIFGRKKEYHFRNEGISSSQFPLPQPSTVIERNTGWRELSCHPFFCVLSCKA